jgi:hypothetical protein
MSDKLKSDELITEDCSDVEDQSLLDSKVRLRRDVKREILTTPCVASLICNIILTTTLIILWRMFYNRSLKDPTFGIWCKYTSVKRRLMTDSCLQIKLQQVALLNTSKINSGRHYLTRQNIWAFQMMRRIKDGRTYITSVS